MTDMTLEQVRDYLRQTATTARTLGDPFSASFDEMADAIDSAIKAREAAEPYCYTVEQKNGLSQGAMCRNIVECEASPLYDPEIDRIIPLYTHPASVVLTVTDEMVDRALNAMFVGTLETAGFCWQDAVGYPQQTESDMRRALVAALTPKETQA